MLDIGTNCPCLINPGTDYPCPLYPDIDYPCPLCRGTDCPCPINPGTDYSCPLCPDIDYRVGWMKSDTRTILTVYDLVVTNNPRISISHDLQHTWSIHIRQLKKSDHGCYMCQLNTKPMRSQMGCVDVQVPPDIVSSESSSDRSLAEGDSARLTCTARGYPPPTITWRREDGQPIYVLGDFRNGQKVRQVTGSTLNLTRATRRQMGAYLCIARNDVPPAISKRIFVYVNFRPEIEVQQQLLGIILGGDVTLDCHVEAFPNTVNYWLNQRDEILLGGQKYSLSEQKRGYRVIMRLRIMRVSRADIGVYRCFASNSMGTSEASIRLHHMQRPPAPAGHGRQTGARHTEAPITAPTPSSAASRRPADLTTALLVVLTRWR
ncbi:lachesin-like [Pollicipes pollicipes]|uniref:lachesin-like n=1 Tax=Pollicipes pollicipes TaxID=41117 RepID=UPI0018858189|nr:lachesin-like [Pollicipes pollicipes]